MRIILLLLAIILVASFPFINQRFIKKQDLTHDKQVIERIIDKYLIENPQKIINAISNFQQQKINKAIEDNTNAAVVQNKDKLLDKHYPIVGQPDNNKVPVIEFFDYSCKYCRSVDSDIEQLLKERKDIYLVFRDFPILGDKSMLMAKSALAVHKIDHSKYLAFHTKAMQSSYDEKDIEKIIKDLGIEESKFKKIRNDPEIEKILKQTIQLAHTIGIGGTPAFIIGNKIYIGALDKKSLVNKIDVAKQEK